MYAITQKSRMFATMLALAAAAGFAGSAQAGADPVERNANVVVPYSDLNLDSAAGNKKLYARLASAAARACGSAPTTREIKRQAEYRSCVDSTLERAVKKVGSPDLQALHRSSAHRVG